jgi:PilZ domain
MATTGSMTNSSANTAFWLERRAALRLALHGGASCHLVAAVGETYWPARVLDISTTGVRLLLRRRFDLESRVLVELANGSRAFARALVMRVAHVEQQPDGSYLLGGEFARRLSHDEVMALIA